MTNQIKLQYSEEVATAIKAKKPVVALESTIISHGLPYPENLETAHALEDAIRSRNAVPATIAVMDGIPKAGLSHDELSRLSDPDIDTMKLSRRDLPFAISKKIDGATTVATTMMMPTMEGIVRMIKNGVGVKRLIQWINPSRNEKRYRYGSHDPLCSPLSDLLSAFNFARRLKTLSGPTPCEYICIIWTSEPERFILNPIHQWLIHQRPGHQRPGLNT